MDNNQKPATKSQLWALYLASKSCGETKDFRQSNLTFEQASQLIEEFNKRTGYKKQGNITGRNTKRIRKSKQQSLEESIKADFVEFFRQKYLDKYVSRLSGVFKQVSVITDDINPDGNKYIFFGSGCSIAWLKYRKCHKYETIYDVTRATLNDDCFKLIEQQIGIDTCKRLEQLGSPIGAILYQDYSINQLNMACLKEFLELNGAKNVQIQVWYD